MRPVLLRTIVATTDLDDASLVALEVAHRLKAIAGADLHIVHVPSGSTDGVAEQLASVLRKARVSQEDVHTHIIEGSPAETIRTIAERLNADVIVLGAHRGRERSTGPLGSTALAVVTESRVPCLVVSDKPLRLPLQKIMVPVDGSDTARGALIVGLSWASALRQPTSSSSDLKTSLIGLHVVDPGNRAGAMDESALDRELDVVRENAGSWAEVAIAGQVVEKPNVPRAILDCAKEEQADLLVLGTRGRGLDASERLGTVSTEVAQLQQTPVLLVSNSVWKSYVDAD